MKKKTILQVLVVLITIVLWVIPTEWFGIDGLTVIQQRTLAIFVFAALMWLFEIIPAWATSVTTIVALLFAVSDKGFLIESAGTTVSYREIMASFADPVIMLFLGGFVMAIAASKVGVDISFGTWAFHMVPFVILLLLIAWVVLMLLYPIKMDKLEIEIPSNAKFDKKFWIVAITMPVTILLWVTEGWTHLDGSQR